MNIAFEWYIDNARTLRGISYLIVMVFFILWGALSAHNRMYHRAAIKSGMGIVLLSFILQVINSDPRVSLYLTTPSLILLAMIVVAFIARGFKS